MIYSLVLDVCRNFFVYDEAGLQRTVIGHLLLYKILRDKMYALPPGWYHTVR